MERTKDSHPIRSGCARMADHCMPPKMRVNAKISCIQNFRIAHYEYGTDAQ